MLCAASLECAGVPRRTALGRLQDVSKMQHPEHSTGKESEESLLTALFSSPCELVRHECHEVVAAWVVTRTGRAWVWVEVVS